MATIAPSSFSSRLVARADLAKLVPKDMRGEVGEWVRRPPPGTHPLVVILLLAHTGGTYGRRRRR